MTLTAAKRTELWVMQRVDDICEDHPGMDPNEAETIAWAEVREGLCPYAVEGQSGSR